MSIEKTPEPFQPAMGSGVEVEVLPDEEEQTEFGEDTPDKLDIPFEANLAEHMSDQELDSVGSDLVEAFEADDRSRSDWYKGIEKGLDLLGLTFEDRTIPWPGACGAFHPLLMETLTRFQAQAIMEIFPAAGPARTQIVGRTNPDKEKLAERIEDEMNFVLTEEMCDYRAETEQLLFRLGLDGSAFRKIYYDKTLDRPAAMYIPAEDFVVAYGTTDLRTCERATHLMRRTQNEIKKMQALKFYRDIELPKPTPMMTDLKTKQDKLKGESAPSVIDDDRYQILEMCVDYDLPGFEDGTLVPGDEETGIAMPYVISIERQSRKILSIYRNWKKEDLYKHRRQYYVKWLYLPGLGFYGTGLIHLIGGLAKASTSILRQLVDAGTLANLPGGLKSRGLRIKGDSTPIMPGEWRDVDIPSGSIKDNLTPLPYKEPSAVLFQLLQSIVDEGKRMGAVADMQVAENNQQAPVGTTLALLERELKVMSAVQGRLHNSLKEEFKLIGAIIRDDMPDKYLTHPEDGASRKQDFAANVLVIPVSDPNAATTGQRILQYQAAFQLAQQMPMIFNLPELAREGLTVMGLKGVQNIVKDPGDIQPSDPVSENMAILTGRPVKAFTWQDHEAHLQVHMMAMQDPLLQQQMQQNPMAPMVMQSAMSHISEHLAFKYRNDIEQQMGIQLPPLGEELPPDVEVQLSKLVASAASKLMDKDKGIAAQQQAQDPVMQQQQQELQIKQQQVQQKGQADQARIQLELKKLQQQYALEQQRLASRERTAGANVGQKIGAELLAHRQSDQDRVSRDKTAGAQLGVDIAKHRAGLRSQDRRHGLSVGVDIAKHKAQLEADKEAPEA